MSLEEGLSIWHEWTLELETENGEHKKIIKDANGNVDGFGAMKLKSEFVKKL